MFAKSQSATSHTVLPFTCKEVVHNERPLVQQSGILASVCRPGLPQNCSHMTLCSLPATEKVQNTLILPMNELLWLIDRSSLLPGCSHNATLLWATVTSAGCRHLWTWSCWSAGPRGRTDLWVWNNERGPVPAEPPDRWRRRFVNLTLLWTHPYDLKHTHTNHNMFH